MSDHDLDNPSYAKIPLSEEQLAAVTVGDLKPLNSTIGLVSSDPAWPSMFARLAAGIRDALGDKVLLLEHVGSTSVPGLSAKPIIDMVLAVPDSADEPSYVPQLERHGYVLRIREAAWFEHRLLHSPGIAGNLHVFTTGSEEIARMLRFRDRLRINAADRKRYEDIKRELAARVWKYTQNYADAKSEVVREILSRANSGADAS